jgi:hypothetical protein
MRLRATLQRCREIAWRLTVDVARSSIGQASWRSRRVDQPWQDQGTGCRGLQFALANRITRPSVCSCEPAVIPLVDWRPSTICRTGKSRRVRSDEISLREDRAPEESSGNRAMGLARPRRWQSGRGRPPELLRVHWARAERNRRSVHTDPLQYALRMFISTQEELIARHARASLPRM